MYNVTLAIGKLSEGQTKVSTAIFLGLLGIWAILSIINWRRNRK